MNIFYTCDDNFVWLAGISIISICENNRDLEQINFYLLGDHVSDDNKNILDKIVTPYGRSFNLIDVPDLDVPLDLTSTRWPRSAYTRLFAGLLMPNEVKTALYLDCDTIINGSLRELSEIELTNNVVYGVKDCISGAYKVNIGLNRDSLYVNAGVLLMNIEEMRKLNMKKAIEDFFISYKKTMFFADQDVLNGVLKGNVGILNPKYDAMTILYVYTYRDLLKLRRPTNYYNETEYNEAKDNPIIVHFTTNMTQIRPWIKGSTHPYAKEFDKYIALSPWANIPKKDPKQQTKMTLIMSFCLALPKYIGIPLLGFLHASLRPWLVKMKKS